MIQRWRHSPFSALSDYVMSSRLSLLAHGLGVAGGRTYTHDARCREGKGNSWRRPSLLCEFVSIGTYALAGIQLARKKVLDLVLAGDAFGSRGQGVTYIFIPDARRVQVERAGRAISSQWNLLCEIRRPRCKLEWVEAFLPHFCGRRLHVHIYASRLDVFSLQRATESIY